MNSFKTTQGLITPNIDNSFIIPPPLLPQIEPRHKSVTWCRCWAGDGWLSWCKQRRGMSASIRTLQSTERLRRPRYLAIWRHAHEMREKLLFAPEFNWENIKTFPSFLSFWKMFSLTGPYLTPPLFLFYSDFNLRSLICSKNTKH